MTDGSGRYPSGMDDRANDVVLKSLIYILSERKVSRYYWTALKYLNRKVANICKVLNLGEGMNTLWCSCVKISSVNEK